MHFADVWCFFFYGCCGIRVGSQRFVRNFEKLPGIGWTVHLFRTPISTIDFGSFTTTNNEHNQREGGRKPNEIEMFQLNQWWEEELSKGIDVLNCGEVVCLKAMFLNSFTVGYCWSTHNVFLKMYMNTGGTLESFVLCQDCIFFLDTTRTRGEKPMILGELQLDSPTCVWFTKTFGKSHSGLRFLPFELSWNNDSKFARYGPDGQSGYGYHGYWAQATGQVVAPWPCAFEPASSIYEWQTFE